MAEASQRLLRLLALLRTGAGYPAAELAQWLAVSTRTVRRDVELLRRSGHRIASGKGPGGRYRLLVADGLPMPFDAEQATALAVVLRTAPASVTGLDAVAARALATVREAMPSRLRHRVDTTAVTAIANPWDLAPPAVPADLLYLLGRAVGDRRTLRFGYDDVEGLEVEPHHLVVWGGRWYLVAWDIGAGRWRALRADRVRPQPVPGRAFTPRRLPGDDVAAFVVGEFDRGDTTDHWPCRGEVVMELAATDVARWAPGGARVTELGPQRCRASLGAWSWAGLAGLIGTFDCEFTVLGPPPLAEACAQLARRYAAAHQGAAGNPD